MHLTVQYKSKNSLMNMNFYIILTTLFLGAAKASSAVTCDECRKASVDLDVHLLSEESLGEQIAILKLALCPQVSVKTYNTIFFHPLSIIA